MMYRYAPRARARSRLGGWPRVYDLSRLTSLTRVRPLYEPLVRDMETVRRAIRRKKYGVRLSVDLEFEIPHSRSENAEAVWDEPDAGRNVLQAVYELNRNPPWEEPQSPTTPALSTARDPFGTFLAWRLTDVDTGSGSLLVQKTVEPLTNRTFLFEMWVRKDAPGDAALLISDTSDGNQIIQGVFVRSDWILRRIRQSFGPVNVAPNLMIGVFVTYPSPTLLGNLDVYGPRAVWIVPRPMPDEAALSELLSRLVDDDYDVDFSLDGGYTYRPVLVGAIEKGPMEDRTVGHTVLLNLVGQVPEASLPATRDGVW